MRAQRRGHRLINQACADAHDTGNLDVLAVDRRSAVAAEHALLAGSRFKAFQQLCTSFNKQLTGARGDCFRCAASREDRTQQRKHVTQQSHHRTHHPILVMKCLLTCATCFFRVACSPFLPAIPVLDDADDVATRVGWLPKSCCRWLLDWELTQHKHEQRTGKQSRCLLHRRYRTLVTPCVLRCN